MESLTLTSLRADSPDAIPALVAPILAELAHGRLVRVEGLDYSLDVFDRWKRVIPLLGEPCVEGENGATSQKDGSTWVDVRYDEALGHTFRHSATAQPLHTDSAYNPSPVDIVFFLCQSQAVVGGETIYVGADTVHREARHADPALHRQLWDLPLPYGKGEHRGRSVPVFSRDRGGVRINWNYYRVLNGSPAVAAVREAFFAFLQDQIIGRGKVQAVRLRPGDVLLFPDQRMLHGRYAFSPAPRCIWKCSFDRRTA